MKRQSLWRVSVAKTPDAEDAVSELLGAVLGQPVSSFFNLETGVSTVTVYCEQRPAAFHEPPGSAGVPPASREPKTGTRRRDAGAPRNSAPVHGPDASPRLEVKASQSVREKILAGLRQIKHCGLKTGSGKVKVAKVRREDWAESWKRHFKPIEITFENRRGELCETPISSRKAETRVEKGGSLLVKPSWSKKLPRKNQAVVVLDPRIQTKRYGIKFLRSIPKCRRVRTLAELKTFFRENKK